MIYRTLTDNDGVNQKKFTLNRMRTFFIESGVSAVPFSSRISHRRVFSKVIRLWSSTIVLSMRSRGQQTVGERDVMKRRIEEEKEREGKKGTERYKERYRAREWSRIGRYTKGRVMDRDIYSPLLFLTTL